MVERVALVSGGTGGHLMPAMVLARAFADCGLEPLLVTEGRDVERELLRRELPQAAYAELPPSRRSRWALPLWLGRAMVAARRLLRAHGVGAVVSTGGRASVPVALAAKSLGLPLFLLEQNAVIGRANRWLARFAHRTHCGLPGPHLAGPRARLTGTPLRPGFGGHERAAARRSLGLALEPPVVLVTGGSQGARALNEIVPEALQRVGRSLQIVHLAGLGNDDAVRRRYVAGDGRSPAQVRPVAAEMDRLFAAADLIVCRGGGTTVAELAAAGRPAIIVPYPHHRDRQQLHNARVLERVGAAIVVEERALTAAQLAEKVARLIAVPQALAAMGHRAREVARDDAAAAIVADVRQVLADRAAAPLANGPSPRRRAAATPGGDPAVRRGGAA